jgi:hypothetical protein
MNAYLKEIADVCNIQKNLTWYVSRHTFATTITLANGIKIENSPPFWQLVEAHKSIGFESESEEHAITAVKNNIQRNDLKIIVFICIGCTLAPKSFKISIKQERGTNSNLATRYRQAPLPQIREAHA